MCQFRKSERLYNYKQKQLLFKKGSSFKVYPFIIFWKTFLKDAYVYTKKPDIKAAIPINKSEHKTIKTYFDIDGNELPKSASFVFPAKAIFAVSKKTKLNAVKRNNIKRLTKEAYRKNKTFFYSFLKKKGLYCLIAFNYIGNQEAKQENIEKKIIVSLHYLINEIECNLIKDIDKS